MKNKFLELMSWEIRDNWAFPILEIIIALAIVQTLPHITLYHDYYSTGMSLGGIWTAFFTKTFFVLVLSTAIVFGRSFGESIEKRKLVVLLSYPVSRARLFLAKYLTNLLMLFLVFGSALLVEGTSLFLFDGVVPPVAWGFTFLILLFEVFFMGSLMTFLTLATRRFGLPVLVFLVYMFGVQYWIYPNDMPLSALRLDVMTWRSAYYLETWYHNTLGRGHSGTDFTDANFVTALTFMLGCGLVLFLVSLIIMRRMDLD